MRNDDHNTFDHVAATLARFIPGVTLGQGHELANTIHSAGMAIVYSGHQEAAEHYWEQLKGAGLTMAPLERCLRAGQAGSPAVTPWPLPWPLARGGRPETSAPAAVWSHQP